MNYTKILLLVGTFGFVGHTYGAAYIALSSNGAWSSGRSPEDAKNRCWQHGGDTCRVMTSNKGRQYLAIPRGNYVSVYRSQNNWFGVAYSSDKNQAWDAALNFCVQGGGFNCRHQNTFVAW